MCYLIAVLLLAACTQKPAPRPAYSGVKPPRDCPPGYHLVAGNICQVDSLADTVPGAP